MAQTTSDLMLGVIWKEFWILDHLKFSLPLLSMGTRKPLQNWR